MKRSHPLTASETRSEDPDTDVEDSQSIPYDAADCDALAAEALSGLKQTHCASAPPTTTVAPSDNDLPPLSQPLPTSESAQMSSTADPDIDKATMFADNNRQNATA